MAVSPFIADPVWNVSVVVWLNNRYFYIITLISDDDRYVLRSHFPLEKWHRHLCFHTTAILLYVFRSVVVVLGRAVPRNSKTL